MLSWPWSWPYLVALHMLYASTVIFYAVLGAWTYGVVRLADLFAIKTAEQEAKGGVPGERPAHVKSE